MRINVFMKIVNRQLHSHSVVIALHEYHHMGNMTNTLDRFWNVGDDMHFEGTVDYITARNSSSGSNGGLSGLYANMFYTLDWPETVFIPYLPRNELAFYQLNYKVKFRRKSLIWYSPEDKHIKMDRYDYFAKNKI